jgi:general secretion pathway protein G
MNNVVLGRTSATPVLRQYRSARGFTLIEVMVVVVILGILGALIVPNIISRPDEAKVIAAQTDIHQIAAALNIYRLDNGVYPSTDQGLQALVEEPVGFPEPRHWNVDGYLPKIPVDPWDEPYLYFSEGRKIEVYSYGADKQEGGESFDADLYLNEL